MIEGFASYAAHQFALSAKQSDGATLREHLEAAWKRSGVMPSTLANGQKLPAGTARLWKDFLELHGNRPTGMNGPESIGFRYLMDWQEFRGVKLAGWQIAAIQRADDAYFAAKAKTQ